MIPEELRKELTALVAEAEEPKEKAVDVMFSLQNYYGHLCDEAMEVGADILGMTPLELESLATFYDFLYRQPVGRYVIHVCDGVVCWMFHQNSIFNYLCHKVGAAPGGTSEDGLFTVLPASCVGNCHQAPAMLINGQFYGQLTPERIDAIVEELRAAPEPTVQCLCR
jgi:NADH-quinone oxidoreductase subunit E